MELRDFIVTPIWLFIIYAVAYYVRPRFTDQNTRKYFIPALTVKIIGAISLGLIYQFYYGGGDTFNYHTRGSRVIWEIFTDNAIAGFRLIFFPRSFEGEFYQAANTILFFNDPSAYFVIRTSAFLDILTFSTYSSTAILFATFSFSGVWALFKTFYNKFRNSCWLLAAAILFLPSVFFWGSGILKDTLTIGALGWVVYGFFNLFTSKAYFIRNVLIVIVGFAVIFFLKKYVLICLIPSFGLWLFAHYTSKVKSSVLRILTVPFLLVIIIAIGYYSVNEIVKEDERYAFQNLAETARITAYDIGFYTGRNAGSGYSLGELDGTFLSMFRLFPSAVNVTLFRPYLWEVNNPLMLIAAIESLIILILTIYCLIKVGVFSFLRLAVNPYSFFCFVFAVVFAFAVGVSTYNFGTLVRYKIPLMPFYLIALVMVFDQWKSERNKSVVHVTE